MRLQELKGALARDDYVVDPHAVAEAMLRRGRGSIAAALGAPPPAHERRAARPWHDAGHDPEREGRLR
jgi:hypothetical protein